jgi:N-acetylmuramoyl-L-alanine amidase
MIEIQPTMVEKRIGRRLVLRRLAGGGAVFWTVLGSALGTSPRTSLGAGATTRDKMALDGMVARRPQLVILDPGHGGHDPGARGANGTAEKDVALAAALCLQAALQKTGRYRVELTRTTDRFVPLEDRVSIARDLRATLFLSMHADTFSDPSVRGASVYTLARQASDADTAALADRENGGGVSGSPVSEILASLAARENRVSSSRIAHQLVSNLERHSLVLPRPERHADFSVLHTAGIPSVLIEMGFLSNPMDEASLNDAEHRDLLAGSLTRAIDAWFATNNET